MNGLNQISVTKIFEQKKDIVFSDVETFVRLAAEYLKKPRNPLKAQDKLLGTKSGKVKVGLVRNSDYALDNFRRLKYQGLLFRNGNIEAWKKPNRADKNGKYPIIIVARGIEAVTKLVEEDGY